ncbi:MAG: DUF5752 family protein [Syntrophobacteraceae bacterium]
MRYARSFGKPEMLRDLIARFSVGSIYYHFIDARQRSAIGNGDFSEWLVDFGEEYKPLAVRLAAIDLGAPFRGACLPQSQFPKTIAVPGIRDSLPGVFQYFVFVK